MGNRLRLPEQVVVRLGDKGLAAVSTFSGPHVLEARAWSGVELRAKDDAGVRVVGYASTYDQPYPIWGGAAAGGFDETIAKGAFDKPVRDKNDVRFLVNHDGVPLARTGRGDNPGTMRLTADDYGLLVDADLDPTSPKVQEIRSAMERGDMDQMSFAFEVLQQKWSPDFSQRTIVEVKLYDVSVVTYPANDQTMALVGASADHAASGTYNITVNGRVLGPDGRVQLGTYLTSVLDDHEAKKKPTGISVDLARAQWYRLSA